MDNEHDTEQAAQPIPSQPSPAPPAPNIANTEAHNGTTAQSQSTDHFHVERKISVADGFMILFTAVIALMAIAQFVIFRRQWQVMNGQLEEMRGTGRQTDELIKNATEQAAAAKTSAENSE